MVLATFLWIMPALTRADVVDFESLPAPGWGTGGLVLKNQVPGIIFENATVFDYSQGIVRPNFAHSGTKAIELCYGIEFCNTPLTASFTVPQKHVKLWVGSSHPLITAQAVVLRAFDAAGNQVASATQTLGPSADFIPISTPLEVSLPSPEISRVTLRYLGSEASPPSKSNNSLAVDDLEFDAQGPAPGCPATQPPGLTVTAPIDGQIVVHGNEVTVQVNLTTPDPYATIQVAATGSTGQTNTYGPVFAPSGPLTYANITGLLFPGSNTLVITAKDCAGTTERKLTVNYRTDVTTTPILVLNEVSTPVQYAEVYGAGVLLGYTNAAGLLNVSPPLNDGTVLVARLFVDESAMDRGSHSQGSYQNWKFRAYITSVGVQNNGSLTTNTVKLEPDPLAPQTLRVLKQNALIGLHIVTSIEWDASASEMETVKQKLIGDSQFLYNATDGQTLMEQVELTDDSAVWGDADYWILANQSLREFVDCPRGGFFGDSMWCGRSRVHAQIHSDSATYAHEFGHYGFDFGDEYADNNPSVQCTFALSIGSIPPGLTPYQSGLPAASCMMFNQWGAPKLCSGRAENPHVKGTNQGDSSCWSTLVDRFKDWQNPARWTIRSPDTRGAIPGLMNGGRLPLEAWEPRFNLDNHTRPDLLAPMSFTVVDSNNSPLPNHDLYLHTTYGRTILEGKTDAAGNLTATGLHVGDQVGNYTIQQGDSTPVPMLIPIARARTSPPSLVPAQTPAARQVPPPVGAAQPRLRRVQLPPVAFRLRSTLTPAKEPKSADLSVWAETVEGKRLELVRAPALKVRSPRPGEVREPELVFNPQTKGYTGSLAGLPPDGELTIEITATDRNGHTETAVEQFRVGRPDPTKATTVSSVDGQLRLTLPEKALPPGAIVSIGPAAGPPPLLAQGEAVVSGPFLVASSAGSGLAIPATLRFQFPHERRQPGTARYDVTSFKVVALDVRSGKWVDRGGTLHPFPIDAMTIRTDSFGTFAVIARRKSD